MDAITLHAAIHEYVTRGWHVLPIWPLDPDGRCACGNSACASPGKHPLGPLVPRGLLEATIDIAIIRQWWASWPDAHLGIRTGMVSGIVVLDVDASKGGWASLAGLEAAHGIIPKTPTVATGAGGAHIYFRHPGGTVANSAGRIAPGIDLRGDGGYVVAPPSGHVSGTSYRWKAGLEVTAVRLAAAPPWLRPSGSERSPLAVSPRLEDGETIAEGGRNDRLMRLGAAFRRYGMTAGEIAAALHTINASRCRPPLDAAEVERIARSVARYQPVTGRRIIALSGGKAVNHAG